MKTFYILAYVSIGLAMAAVIGGFFINQNHAASVESVYGVKVITQKIYLSGPNKLVIEKDGQRLTCYEPSSDDVKSKTPLSCDAVTKIDAKE